MAIRQALEKLRNPHTINLLGNGIMSVLSMLQVAILFNYLSIDHMGIWFFFQGTIGLVDTFRAGLISTAFITSYAGTTKERAAEIAGSGWFLAILITLIFVAVNIGYLVVPYHVKDQGLDIFMNWLGVVFMLNLPSFIASCVAQAEQRFDRLLYIRAFSTGISIVLVLGLILTKNINLMTVIYSGFLAGGLTSLMTMVLGWSRVNTITKATRVSVEKIFAFGKYSVGTVLGSSLFRSSDIYIINFMLGPASLAVYNLALRLMELVEIPMRSLAATIMPPLSAAYNQDNRVHVIHLLKKYAGMLTIILIPVVVGSLFFAEVAIWIVDKKYLSTEAANILRILMTFALLMPVERFMALTIDAIHQPKVNMIKLVFMLIANVAGDFLGIYLTGSIYGVAIGGILPVLTGLFISYRFLQDYQKFHIRDVYSTGYKELNFIVRDYLGTLRKSKS